MRKLAWFVIILFAVAFGLTLAAAGNPDFKQQLVNALSYAGGSVYSVVSAKWMDLANFVSANGTYFLVYTLSLLVVGGIFWIVVGKLWTRRPHLFGIKTKITSGSKAIVGATEVHSQTPVGATTRPPVQTTKAPLEPVPEAEVTEKTGAET